MRTATPAESLHCLIQRFPLGKETSTWARGERPQGEVSRIEREAFPLCCSARYNARIMDLPGVEPESVDL